MEKNGRRSATGNSRHVDIRYFLVKDQANKGKTEVRYCPTHAMLADYFTKPLQGSLFKKLRNFIMGWEHIQPLLDPVVSSTEERVEQSILIDQKIAVDDDVSITESESTEITVIDYTKLSYADAVENSIEIAAE